MHILLSEIKTILDHECALTGPFVPLPGGADGHPTTPDPYASRNAGCTRSGAAPRPDEDARRNHDVRPNRDDRPLNAPEPHPVERPDDEFDMTHHDLFGNPPTPQQEPNPYERIHALIPQVSPLREMMTLGEVEAYVRDNVLIPLDETRKNPVFGVGDPDADLMVIGEAPGADEDAQGEPFVGRAGQLLDKILAAVDFAREDVYIANILKSRPPNNRDPLAAEVEAHVPILYKQIALIRPKLLLCVGKTSGTTLLDRQTTLSALRQKVHDFHGLPLLVTYHPAALLRNPGWKRPTWEDVQLLRRRFDALVQVAA